MPSPLLSAENSPTAAAAMAKAPSVLAARSRSLDHGDATKQTSLLGGPVATATASRVGSSPLDNLLDVGEVRGCRTCTFHTVSSACSLLGKSVLSPSRGHVLEQSAILA